jgi:long-subunit fatty acid transport protein
MGPRALRCFVSAVALAAITLPVRRARANTELVAYDGRSVGMGASGLITNGAALYQNPAQLDGTKHLAVTLVVTPVFAQGTAPLDQDNVNLTTDVVVAPVGLLGANVRVLDRLTLGIAAYPSGASGSKLHDLAGDERRATTATTEAAVGAAFAILPTLSIGAAWRVVHAHEQISNFLVSSADVSGTSYVGGHVGLYWRPTSRVRLGFAWRSKVVVDVDGPLTAAGVSTNVTTQLATPHTFKLGAEWSFLDERLILAMGMGYYLYSDSNDVQTISATLFGQHVSAPIYAKWHDSVAGVIGGEYWITPHVPVRFGIGTAHSATPHDRPAPFTSPPGWFKSFSTGTGLRLEHWDFDVGANYAFASDTVENPTQDPPTVFGAAAQRNAGTYALTIFALALSGTYRF